MRNDSCVAVINSSIFEVDMVLLPIFMESVNVAMPILIACPVSLMVPVVAEACPKYFLSTELIMILVFGEEKIPNPIPIKHNGTIINAICVCWVRNTKGINPMMPISIPIPANVDRWNFLDNADVDSEHAACNIACMKNMAPT